MIARALVMPLFLCASLLVLFLAGGAGLAQQSSQRSSDAVPAAKCNEGEELDEDDLCYPKCKDKFKGEGPLCKEICPPNTQDHDTHCLSGPAVFRKKKYERGPGRPLN